MKVLFLTGSYPTKDNPNASIFIHNQAKAIQKSGNDVVVLLTDMRSIRKKRKLGFSKYVFDGIQVYQYAIPCGPIPYILDELSKIAAKKGFERIIEDYGKPDIIHSHFSGAGFSAIRLRKIYKVPLVLTEHGSNIIKEKPSYHTQYIAKKAYREADNIIAVSQSLKLKMLKMTDKKIEVLPNILPEYFKRVNRPKYDRYTFLTVANINAGKRIDLVIKAFSKVQREIPNIQLKIVGSGPLELEMKKLVLDLKLENNIEFLGSIKNIKMPGIYQKSHCFVLPSDFETFGVVYIEAAACGLPIIATNCVGAVDYITDNVGIKIPCNDIEALSNAMKDIYINFSNYNSEHISNEIRSVFKEKIIVGKLLEIYSKNLI